MHLTRNRLRMPESINRQTVCKLALVVGAAVSLLSTAWTQDTSKTIDTEKSALTIRVGKTGFFSAFGHEHEISAPIEEGSFSVNPPAMEVTVDARKLRVMDKDISDKDRAEIQETMLGAKVLDSERFPRITFRSSQIDAIKDGRWMVHGELMLHSQTKPVVVRVDREGDHYRGSAELKQTDFGITPVTVAGGTVKVKDQVRVEFDVVGK